MPTNGDSGAEASGDERSSRVSSVHRGFEERIANPLFERLLRSRLHWPASRWLLLLAYRGRRSGRTYSLPVLYERVEGRLVVVTPERESTWWRNFETPRACTAWHHGESRSATGTVLDGDERDRSLRSYLENHGLLTRVLGFGPNPASDPEGFARATRELVVVAFELGAENGRDRER